MGMLVGEFTSLRISDVPKNLTSEKIFSKLLLQQDKGGDGGGGEVDVLVWVLFSEGRGDDDRNGTAAVCKQPFEANVRQGGNLRE